MRTALLTLLVCLLMPTAEAAKCRRGSQITFDYDPCPPGYTDITGQKNGETWGMPRCTDTLPADATGCLLPKPLPENTQQNKARQIWKEPKKPACREGGC